MPENLKRTHALLMHGFNITTQLTLTINELMSRNAGNISYLKDCLILFLLHLKKKIL